MKVYLAKAGRVSGPYSESDLERMRASGELERFAWVWTSSAPSWQPLDPMPAPLDENNLPESLAEVAPLPRRPEQHQQRRPMRAVQDIEGVCHDYRNVVAGRVVRVTDSGCELLVDGGSTPKWNAQAKLYLNLLNSRNGQTIDVVAHLAGVSHSREGWTYRLDWESVPELLRASG